jgi:hypothetical protein
MMSSSTSQSFSLTSSVPELILSFRNHDLVLVDKNGRPFAFRAAVPWRWTRTHYGAFQRLQHVRDYLRNKARTHRGPFDTAAVGWSYGGGQTRPTPFQNHPADRELMLAFLHSPEVADILSIADRKFS